MTNSNTGPSLTELFEKAKYLQNIKKYDLAIQKYIEILSIAPAYYIARCGLGMCLIRVGKIDEGVKELEATLRDYPEYYKVYAILCAIYSDENSGKFDYQKALSYAKEMIRLQPQTNYAYLKLADLLISNSGEASEIWNYLDRALSLDPNSVKVHYLRAEAYWRLEKDYKKAEESYNTALQIDPNNITLKNSYGIFLVDREKFDQAQAEFLEAARIDPSSKQSLKNVKVLEKEEWKDEKKSKSKDL
jgi:Tfp pilus assembly protein PilF